MPQPAIHRAFRLIALSVCLAACVDDGGTVVVFPKVLRAGTWTLDQANGDALPAKVAERTIGIAQEETFVDSATIVVEPTGDWQQRVHLRFMLNGALDREELLYDSGVWSSEPVGFAFVSDLRNRTFSASLPSPLLLLTNEPVLSWTSAPNMTGAYRLVVP